MSIHSFAAELAEAGGGGRGGHGPVILPKRERGWGGVLFARDG